MEKESKYQGFTSDDFINDVSFQNWVLQGDDADFWVKFIEDNPSKKEEVDQAAKILKAIPFDKELSVEIPSDQKIQASFDRISEILGFKETKVKKAKVVSIKKFWWAAAILILVGGIGYYLFNGNTSSGVGQVAQQIDDITPGGDKAVLTLADGSTVVLDSAGNGVLSLQGNTQVLKEEGALSYNANDAKDISEVKYNSVKTPVGGQYQITLSDGTKVWLNSLSSIKFPTAFRGEERKVEVTGEVYFEVSKRTENGKRIPFIVQVGDQEVEVLGTSFNVMAYADEPNIQTTLAEGKVALHLGDEELVLRPGEQGIASGGNLTKKKVAVSQYIAWKNNEFVFNDTELRQALRVLSRWYDFEVEYQGNPDNTYFFGSIGREKNLSEVLKVLEASGLQFKIEKQGTTNKLIVLK